jgi:hypothetical protein
MKFDFNFERQKDEVTAKQNANFNQQIGRLIQLAQVVNQKDHQEAQLALQEKQLALQEKQLASQNADREAQRKFALEGAQREGLQKQAERDEKRVNAFMKESENVPDILKKIKMAEHLLQTTIVGAPGKALSKLKDWTSLGGKEGDAARELDRLLTDIAQDRKYALLAPLRPISEGEAKSVIQYLPDMSKDRKYNLNALNDLKSKYNKIQEQRQFLTAYRNQNKTYGGAFDAYEDMLSQRQQESEKEKEDTIKQLVDEQDIASDIKDITPLKLNQGNEPPSTDQSTNQPSNDGRSLSNDLMYVAAKGARPFVRTGLGVANLLREKDNQIELPKIFKHAAPDDKSISDAARYAGYGADIAGNIAEWAATGGLVGKGVSAVTKMAPKAANILAQASSKIPFKNVVKDASLAGGLGAIKGGAEEGVTDALLTGGVSAAVRGGKGALEAFKASPKLEKLIDSDAASKFSGLLFDLVDRVKNVYSAKYQELFGKAPPILRDNFRKTFTVKELALLKDYAPNDELKHILSTKSNVSEISMQALHDLRSSLGGQKQIAKNAKELATWKGARNKLTEILNKHTDGEYGKLNADYKKRIVPVMKTVKDGTQVKKNLQAAKEWTNISGSNQTPLDNSRMAFNSLQAEDSKLGELALEGVLSRSKNVPNTLKGIDKSSLQQMVGHNPALMEKYNDLSKLHLGELNALKSPFFGLDAAIYNIVKRPLQNATIMSKRYPPKQLGRSIIGGSKSSFDD